MKKRGFNSEKYIDIQTKKIKERVSRFSKLYLEFGGKLFDDYHASRVLPGFNPDNKIKVLSDLKDDIEIIIAINANDIEKGKIRSDLNITYAEDLLRLIGLFKDLGIAVCGVNITHFNEQEKAKILRNKLLNNGVNVSYNYIINNYPNDLDAILSAKGFGKNEVLKTSKNIIVVTAPGPGSGKLATCLNQLYHDNLNNIKSGYAKFETFPIWNVSINSPINIAYEAATIDLDDVNIIDPFHLEAYNEIAINYNRDVEAFPILNELLKRITGKQIYKSPTDMGVNMVGYAIDDEQECIKASNDEILRRYFDMLVQYSNTDLIDDKISKFQMMFQKCNIKPDDRKIVKFIDDFSNKNNVPMVAIEVEKGKYITGKESEIMSATSACLLNTLKYFANIDENEKILDITILTQVLNLKNSYLKSNSYALNSIDILEILSICSLMSANCKKAIDALELLANLDGHSTSLLSKTDLKVLKKLHISITQDVERNSNSLFF